MFKLAIAPSVILEGENVLNKEIGFYVKRYGTQGSIIGEEYILKKFDKKLATVLPKNIQKLFFKGECSIQEITRLSGLAKKKRSTYIIGIGGGKAIDTAKAVADKCKTFCITIPTSPATGAAASALSAVYSNTGVAENYLLFDRSPDLVVLDYKIIATAPVYMLCAGMADALAKYYESFAYTKGKARNVYERVALDTAQLIHNKIYKIGKKAKKDLENKKISEAFKEIVKINIILAPFVGGVGGEGCRAVAAHAVNNGLTRVKGMRKFLHGEVVGFGNLVQLKLENKSGELGRLTSLYKKLNLPYNFKWFNQTLSDKELDTVINHICSEKETLKNMPKKITKQQVREVFKQLMCVEGIRSRV